MSEILELPKDASNEGIEPEYEYKYILTEQIYKVLINESFKDISFASNQKILFSPKSKKTRPYIYFDTPNCGLLNRKGQFSVRKRENDYFITFKKPEYGFESSALTGRVENNYKISLAEGEAIFKSASLESIALHEAVVKASIFGEVNANEWKELCRFTVETTRFSAFLDQQEVCEIAVDKLTLPNGINLFELEIEARHTTDKGIKFESFEQITEKILEHFVLVIRDYTNKEYDFVANRIILPKFRRVLERTQKSDFHNSASVLDWTNGANHLLNLIMEHIEANKGSHYFIPCMISYYPHPSYKIKGKEGNEAYTEGRSKITKLVSVYIKTLLDKINKDNEGFSIWKILMPESETMLLFQFKASGESGQGERINKQIELFIEKTAKNLLSISGDVDLFNKIQLNFGIGNKNAFVDGRGLAKKVRDVTFYNFSSEMEKDLLEIHANEIHAAAYKNLRNLEDKRYDLTKMNIKSPCSGLTTNKKDTMYKIVMK